MCIHDLISFALVKMIFCSIQFEQFVVEDLQDVFNFDGLVTSHPVYVPVTHPDEINEIFDRISYAKVNCFIIHPNCGIMSIF